MTSEVNTNCTLRQILCTTTYQAQTAHTEKVLLALSKCRTHEMGYHTYRCTDKDCNAIKYVYHSCRNRHCPQCGSMQQIAWMEDRMQELLPINYYHVVFTLPQELNSLILGNRKVLLQLLFSSASKTLLQFANDKKWMGATPGIIMVLHTWGQQLSFHPHVHCIVSGGGIVKDDKHVSWKNGTRNKDNFLFSTKAMAIVYRSIYLKELQALIKSGVVKQMDDQATQSSIQQAYSKEWVVYAKAPFGGPQQVVTYLAQYTHKVAISNKRIVSVTDTTVTFKYKDYADNSKAKLMTLSKQEFIRRFEMHILPSRFFKIRSYGYLGNRNRHKNIAQIKIAMQLPPSPPRVKIPYYIRLQCEYNTHYLLCPECSQLTLSLNILQAEQLAKAH